VWGLGRIDDQAAVGESGEELAQGGRVLGPGAREQVGERACAVEVPQEKGQGGGEATGHHRVSWIEAELDFVV
jgi:hypothetical protein